MSFRKLSRSPWKDALNLLASWAAPLDQAETARQPARRNPPRSW